MAVELVVGRKNRRMDREKGGPHKFDGPSQEGQVVQAGRKYKRKSQIQDDGRLTDCLNSRLKSLNFQIRSLSLSL